MDRANPTRNEPASYTQLNSIHATDGAPVNSPVVTTSKDPAAVSRAMQATYFCVELNHEVESLDREIDRLTRTVSRQSAIPALHHHLAATKADLKVAMSRRSELCAMLGALGHSYPCSHSVQEQLNSP